MNKFLFYFSLVTTFIRWKILVLFQHINKRTKILSDVTDQEF